MKHSSATEGAFTTPYSNPNTIISHLKKKFLKRKGGQNAKWKEEQIVTHIPSEPPSSVWGSFRFLYCRFFSCSNICCEAETPTLFFTYRFVYTSPMSFPFPWCLSVDSNLFAWLPDLVSVEWMFDCFSCLQDRFRVYVKKFFLVDFEVEGYMWNPLLFRTKSLCWFWFFYSWNLNRGGGERESMLIVPFEEGSALGPPWSLLICVLDYTPWSCNTSIWPILFFIFH